jgi:tetratricopeptide (TPR) repeat protein
MPIFSIILVWKISSGGFMRRLVVLSLMITILLSLSACSKSPEEKRADYLASAEKYASQNKYAEAAIQFQNALKIAPDDATTNIKLGELQLIQQKPGEAFSSFMKASRIDSKNIKAHSNLATIYLLARKYDEATREVNIVLAIDPANAHAKEILAQSLYLSGKKVEALNMLQELIEKKQAGEGIYSDAIQIYFETGNMDEALKLIDEGLKKFPSSTGIRMVSSPVYLANKQPDLAKKMAEEAYSLSNGDINSGLFLAGFASKNNMPDRFASVIAQMKAKYPNDYRIYLLEAEEARKRKDTDNAIIFAKKALELNFSEQGAVLLSELYLQKGNNDLAIETISQAITKLPSSVSLKTILTRQLIIKGDTDKALQTLDPLIKAMPDNPEIAMLAARIYLMRGEQEKARSFIENALKDKKDDVRLHAMLASIYFKSSEYRSALAEVEITHKAGSSSVELLNIGVISALNLGMPDEALTYIQLLKKAAPQEWATIYSEITYFLFKKDSKSAFLLAEKAIKTWPDKMDALTIYAQTGSVTIGVASTIQGISSVCAKTNSANCMLVLSVLYEKAGMKNDALAKIKGAIALNPGREDLYYALADFYARNDMIDLAISEFKNLLNKKPDDLKSATMLAILLQGKGDIENAEKTYEYILERSPSNKIAANNLAWILAERGKKSDLDRAMDLATKAKRSDPENPSIADTLGYIYLQKGMLDNAKDQFIMALDKNPDEPSFNYHMAQALVKDGKKKEAAAYLRTALKTPAFTEKEAAQKLLKSIGG